MVRGTKYFGGSYKDWVPADHCTVFAATKLWLDRYFYGRKPDPDVLPLRPAGSDFRQTVWARLLRIPFGQTVTYGTLAAAIAAEQGRPVSAQAVGGAVGHNPVSIVIPCHRVIGANGNLTGYAGGVDKKLWLLTREGVDTASLRVPQKGTAL